MTTESLLDLGNDLELWRVHVDDAREQDVNARSMPPAMFERLQATIARDGRLESLPLLAQTDDGLEVVSGHHRLRASRAGGVTDIYALVDVSGLTHAQVAAKQLAHNSISGTDDETLLAQIFASIDDVDARLEAFIDPDTLKLPPVDQTRLPRIDLDFEFRTVLFTFLPRQHERFTRAVDQLQQQTPLEHDELALIDLDLYAWWNACMTRTRREYDARSLTTVVSKIIDTVLERYGIDRTDPADVDPEAWVPLSDIFGTALVPPDVADVLRMAVEQATESGIHSRKTPHALLLQLASDYVGLAPSAPVPA